MLKARSKALSLAGKYKELFRWTRYQTSMGIAYLDEADLPFLQYAFDKIVGEDDGFGKDLIHLIWQVLQETHRLRCVK